MPDDFADFGFVADDKAMQAILAKKSTGTPLKSKAIAELWDDAAKSKAFFSARVTSADILEGLRSQINHVISGQASTEEAVWWMKRFLESKGDSALRDMGFATVEEAKATDSLAELGSHRRLTLIVEQNVAMARSAREWQQMQEDADIVPFVQYHTREDGSVRNSHALLNKKVFRKDDPALKRIFPPQDFRCRCRLDELDEDDAAGLPIQHGLPDGWKPPESGYSFDPEAWAAQGQDARDKWGEDLVEPFKADSMAHGKGRIEALQNNRSVMADLAQNSTDPRQKAEAAQAVDSLDQRISQVQADMQAKQTAKQAEEQSKADAAARAKSDNEKFIVKEESPTYDVNSKTTIEPWPADFPKVTINTNVQTLKKAALQPGETLDSKGRSPNYNKAKAGDAEAAKEVVKAVVNDERLIELKQKYPNAIVVPIRAQEESGKNKIPEAYARHMEEIHGFKVDTQIYQTNEVRHTGATAKERFERPPIFAGAVIKGGQYILCDDVSTTGSTFQGIRKHILEGKGKVIVATALAVSKGGTQLGITKDTLEKLREKFNINIEELNFILRSKGVDSIEHLTDSQARYLLKFADVKRIRAEIIAE